MMENIIVKQVIVRSGDDSKMPTVVKYIIIKFIRKLFKLPPLKSNEEKIYDYLAAKYSI